MKESSSIFSTIYNLFEERQGPEKSGRRAAKRRWKRRKIFQQEDAIESSRPLRERRFFKSERQETLL
jgi:hypothetical protein